ncbi:MAG: hypothetical protein F6K14_04125 [Symploca sp. SIO2C1]|nr:hypothetical protein [Symploca sp. SIO2C1]
MKELLQKLTNVVIAILVIIGFTMMTDVHAAMAGCCPSTILSTEGDSCSISGYNHVEAYNESGDTAMIATGFVYIAVDAFERKEIPVHDTGDHVSLDRGENVTITCLDKSE